jgi:AraC family transcriptional regulator
VFNMNAILPVSGASPIDLGSSAILARLLIDAYEDLDRDMDCVRISLSRAVALVGGATAPGEALARGGLAPWQARKVSALVEAKLECGVRITELAASARLSKAYFSRAFKAHFGRSPMRYVLEKRIARAQRLMLESNDRLSEVAQACGFTDQAHLCRVFRRLVGASPRTWRRAHMGP